MSMHASQAKETAFQRPELATSARRVEEITEQMKGLGEEYVRLSAELGEHQELVQAAHDQQEVMRREMEALNVQEASIAAQKKDLQAKMSK
jgi:chromosome segregation ATPase